MKKWLVQTQSRCSIHDSWQGAAAHARMTRGSVRPVALRHVLVGERFYVPFNGDEIEAFETEYGLVLSEVHGDRDGQLSVFDHEGQEQLVTWGELRELVDGIPEFCGGRVLLTPCHPRQVKAHAPQGFKVLGDWSDETFVSSWNDRLEVWA